MDYNQHNEGINDKRIPYISEEPKFTRERYILVAAIDIATMLGAWNICVAESIRNQ
jgi:hypothetical protein